MASCESGSNLTFESWKDFCLARRVQVWRMRTGISITLKPGNRLVGRRSRNRNAPHKHIWWAEIVMLSADGGHCCEVGITYIP
jgi:hypothetical protein